jgi:class 3 adenylate cyclase
MEQATLDLLARWVAVTERGLAVQGAALPPLPRDPMVGAEGWAAMAVELARREGAPGDVQRAHDLLVEVERRGGVCTSGLIALVPRVLGGACALLGDDDGAIAHLRRAIDLAVHLRAEPERARAQAELAAIFLRQGQRAEGLELLDAAVATFRRLRMAGEADRASQLSGTLAEVPAARPREEAARSVVFFTDVVESTRLTEELGAGPYRTRARLVENAVTSAITVHGGTVVPGISLGDGFIGLFSAISPAIAAARQCVADVGPSGLHLHLALHEGEVLVDGPRVYGAAVNLAARICGLSGPDEILVSSGVHDAATTSGIRFVDRGEHALKGIAAPVQVYALVEDGAAG